MKKTAFIIHGWDGSPNEPMIKSIGKYLEKEGFEVTIPEMPNPEHPKISSWVNKLKEVITSNDEEIYLVGHSIGCQTIIRFLEKENIFAKGVVFIAPWLTLTAKTIKGDEERKIATPWLRIPIDFSKVRPAIGNLTCIFSDNDPFVPLSNKELFVKNLGAKIIIEKNKGHYSPEDNCTENKVAVDEILSISK